MEISVSDLTSKNTEESIVRQLVSSSLGVAPAAQEPKGSSQPCLRLTLYPKEKGVFAWQRVGEKGKKGVRSTLLTMEDLVGPNIEIFPEREPSDQSTRVISNHMSSNVFCPKIPSIENVNKSMHVVGKTHEGESSRKSPRVRRKVHFPSEEHVISNPKGVIRKMLKIVLSLRVGKTTLLTSFQMLYHLYC